MLIHTRKHGLCKSWTACAWHPLQNEAPQTQATREASGGISMESVRAIAETGVDRIAVGAITHSAPQVDFGLDMD